MGLAKWIAGLAVALAVLGAQPGAAADRLYTDVSGIELAALLEQKGFEAWTESDDWGDPVVYGALGPLRFKVWPHDCSGNPRRCQRVDFSAGFKAGPDITEAKLDAFNETYVFGKAYLSDDGTAYVDFPVNLSKGVTESNVLDNIGLWSDILRAFADYIGWYEGS